MLEKIDAWLFGLFNALAGRSWGLDALIDLPLTNSLVKAAVIGACFLFAWHAGPVAEENARQRKMLLITAAASLLALCVTQPMGRNILHPRPFVAAQQLYRYQDARLAPGPRLAFRAPLAGDTKRDLDALRAGEIAANDLGSFPSDHAAFFLALALGIWFASRAAGAVALGWTLVVILAPRIVAGQHWPLDIAAGAAIGAAVLLALRWLVLRHANRPLDAAAAWTMRHSPLATAILFLFLFAAADAMGDVRDGLGVAKDIAKYWIAA